MTVRVAYNLFTQRPKQELDDFAKWVKMTRPGEGERLLSHERRRRDARLLRGRLRGLSRAAARSGRVAGAGADASRRLLAENRWPFRLHATYDESISRFLDVFEAVNRDVPFEGLRWFFDHAETVTRAQPRTHQGPGRRHRHPAPHGLSGRVLRQPLRRGRRRSRRRRSAQMLRMGIPVGAGTDATRVASYNPWVSLYWLVTGKTVGGTALYPEANRLDRAEALRRYTLGSAWFSGEEEKKGAIVPGHLADLAVLSADYFSVPEEEIKRIESVLTLVGGKVVHGAGGFASLAPPALPVMPDWSPVKEYGGYYQRGNHAQSPATARARPTGLQRALPRVARTARPQHP